MPNGHGGSRLGAGQKKKPLADKIRDVPAANLIGTNPADSSISGFQMYFLCRERYMVSNTYFIPIMSVNNSTVPNA